jgi:RecA-family ATPase
LPDIRYEPGAHNWLIEGLLPARGLAVLFARWKSYKTFIALDLSMAIARADLWAGRKVKPGAVVYVAAEGALGLRKRIAAYQARHPGDRSPFYLMELRPR